MAGYIADHRAADPPRKFGRPKGLNRRERFDDLQDAMRACDRWQRSECRQSIVDTSTGQRWIRRDDDREWTPRPNGNLRRRSAVP